MHVNLTVRGPDLATDMMPQGERLRADDFMLKLERR